MQVSAAPAQLGSTSRTPGLERTKAAAVWFTPGRFALCLGLLILATFPGVFLGRETFVFRDFGLFSFPVAHFHRECFWRGEIPLWNPYSHCGIPFLAQWNTLVLYPASLIYLLLPLPWSLSVFCLAHLFWGGLGMYFLTCRWTSHRLAAALAGVIFSFNGLTLNFLMWPSHMATFSWLPWVVWLVPEGWRSGGKWLVRGVLAASMQMLSGGPETILFTWLILGTLACGEWIGNRAERKPIMLRLCVVVALVALVSSAQLLPFLQLLAHSQRDSGYGSSEWPMPAWGWANFLVPLYRTQPDAQGVCFQPGQYWTSSYYAGIGTVVLVAAAVRRARSWRVIALGALLLLGLILALGNAGVFYSILRSWFPPLGVVRYPVKFVILVLALAPLLAALGAKAGGDGDPRERRFLWLCAGAVVVLVGAVVLLDSSSAGHLRTSVVQNGVTRVLLLAASVGLIAGSSSATGERRWWLSALLILITWIDLVTHAPNQNPTADRRVYTAGWAKTNANWNQAPELGKSRAMISAVALENLKNHSIANAGQSYLLKRLGFLANCNLLDLVPQAHGFFSLLPAEINDATAVSYVHTNADFSALLDFMGVRQITAPGAAFEWAERPTAMPLVTAGQQSLFADDRTTFNAFQNTNLNLRQAVFLPLEARDSLGISNQTRARVLAAEFGNQNVQVQAEAPEPTLAVIAQTYYPAWKAYVDGKPARIWRANFAFQAVAIPQGKHQISLVYEDRAFAVGLFISSAGLAICLALWLRARQHDQRVTEGGQASRS